MTQCQAAAAVSLNSQRRRRASGDGPAKQLPTLQRNAIRKLFDRPDFSPEEVAGLGYRRLQQAEGIGHKGLEAISSWLRQYGFELKEPEAKPSSAKEETRARRNIELAVRLLRAHGYVVDDRQAESDQVDQRA